MVGKSLLIDVITTSPYVCPLEKKWSLIRDQRQNIYLNKIINKAHQDLFLLVLVHEYFMC